MREISHKNLIPNTLYYIQREKILGNGKQKGIFIQKVNYFGDGCYAFKHLTDVVGDSGYGYGNGHQIGYSEYVYHFDIPTTKFYLPEKEEIEIKSLYRFAINKKLREITGDPYFTFY